MNKEGKEIKVVEAEGKDTNDAIEKALKKLRVPRTKVKVEILSEEHKGLFGMEGSRPARVRVSVKEH